LAQFLGRSFRETSDKIEGIVQQSGESVGADSPVHRLLLAMREEPFTLDFQLLCKKPPNVAGQVEAKDDCRYCKPTTGFSDRYQ
jgi:hypothetical protein